jgi:hypothetical protein
MCCLIYHDVDESGFYPTLITLAIYVLQIVPAAVFMADKGEMRA